MKTNKTYLLSKEATDALDEKAKATGRKKSQLVERAILRCYGNGAK